VDSEQILVYGWVSTLLFGVGKRGIWANGRDRYSKGGDGGKGRYQGIYFWGFQAGLLGLTVYNGVTMILA
jgi:hypothetical protein